MGLKLRLAAVWTPSWAMRRMLARVDSATSRALDGLVGRRAGEATAPPPGATRARRGLEEARAAMASRHEASVRALVDAVGRARAVELGRQAMYPVGVMLGREASKELSVGGGPRELERAARVLYRVLGIHFELEEQGDGTTLMRVDRCALARHYSEEACLVLSAADEGVVAGLSPDRSMLFERRMTGGCEVCVARIREARA